MDLANVDLPDIVRRYAAGESVQIMAHDAGVSRRTIYNWMLAGTGDAQYADLVTHALVRRVADADADLATAQEPVHIARARETAKFARMDLERRRPALYGQRGQEITINIGDLGARLDNARERVVSEQRPAAQQITK